MERKLASVKKIDAIIPIEGADAVDLAVIGGWQAVVKKGEFQAGDLIIYCEVDSFLPVREEYEFLRKSSFRTMYDGSEGFRIKTMRLKGKLSQGLVLPLESAYKGIGAEAQDVYEEYMGEPFTLEEGNEVTTALGISKWDTPPAGIYQGQGKGGLPQNAKGYFPSWLPKTDEERIQNCWNELPKDIAYVETEKLHGTSATYYLKDGIFGICSRNLDLKVEEGGLYTEMANELGIEDKLRELAVALYPEGDAPGFALQGEIIGEGINGNYNNIQGRQFYVFNVFNEQENGYLPHKLAKQGTEKLGFRYVPIITEDYRLPATCAEALLNVEGPSTIGKQPIREGSVIRHSLPNGRRISAKVVSNQYLLKEK